MTIEFYLGMNPQGSCPLPHSLSPHNQQHAQVPQLLSRSNHDEYPNWLCLSGLLRWWAWGDRTLEASQSQRKPKLHCHNDLKPTVRVYSQQQTPRMYNLNSGWALSFQEKASVTTSVLLHHASQNWENDGISIIPLDRVAHPQRWGFLPVPTFTPSV